MTKQELAHTENASLNAMYELLKIQYHLNQILLSLTYNDLDDEFTQIKIINLAKQLSNFDINYYIIHKH
jgi:hypothetical protein